ncbi:hypothetical protein BH11MYX1_BH11MYX1_19500 [soil metagenome]
MGPRALVVIVAAGACGDNQHHGSDELRVTPSLELHTSEAGGTTTFSVALADLPDADVIVELASSRPSEGTVAPAELVFARAGSMDPQLVTLTGVDDPYADGPQPYTVTLSARGDLLAIPDVELHVTNDDNDVAGAIVTPTQGLLTSESGTSARFMVRLTAQPLADVTLPIASSNLAEATVDHPAMVFTPNNYDVPQLATITGVDDQVADGIQPYTIAVGPATSLDPAFAGLDPEDVQGTNIDDDLQAIVVVPTTGLVTTEPGGTATFQVVLATQPTADVTIALASTQPGEATASTSSLVFTSATWAVPQTVTVTGQDDRIVDGDVSWTITLAPAVTTDPRYSNLDADDVHGTNLDDDTPGIEALPDHGLVTSERATTDHFAVTLHSQPIAQVTVPIASSDPTEATVYPAQLSFTPATWNVAQTVTLRGVDDSVPDGDVPYTVTLGPASSVDPIYQGLSGDPVSAINLDNDRAGFFIDPPGGLVVSEFGDSETFTIVLAKRPTAPVRVNLSSSDVTEGFVAPAQLVFTIQNWNQPHTVTVTGVDDLLADGNVAFTILTAPATSTDAIYNGLDPADLSVTNIDNELAQVYVKTKPLLLTTENGGTVTYLIRLTRAPTGTVVCPTASNDPSEGIANPAGVTFGPGNFGFQTVTITGIDDALPDGDQLYDVIDGVCTSADPAYSGADPGDVHLVNRDND